ncbi:FAD:protein FMN transferase [Opitutaceae bacterium EW11]|nr:FAD:protein FMN transferase [Opitutaceae bacterium EW11]
MSAPAQLKPSSSASSGPALRRVAWRALGTECVLMFATDDPRQAEAFQRAAVQWVTDFEQRYSRFRPDSLVSRINAAAGVAPVEVDAEMDRMLDLCELVFRTSEGLIDPSALPLMRAWDYKAAQPRIPTQAEIDAARRLVGWRKVARRPGSVFLPEPGMALDFGGWGKEYAVDCVAELAAGHGLDHVLVDFGHDLRGVGAPPGRPAWHIGIEDPDRPGSHRESVALRNAAMASSGDYLRGFTLGGRRFGHIIDVRTGRPVMNGCAQSTVIAPSCLHAGILSTASFIAGTELGVRMIESHFGTEGMLVGSGTRFRTRGFFKHVVQN